MNLDLSAELAAQTAKFNKQKEKGKYSVGISSGIQKKSLFLRSNKGVASRNARDAVTTSGEAVVVDSRAALERKARLYDKMRREGGNEESLVDFERKNREEQGVSDSSESESEVEYQDEFGRTRYGPRSAVPQRQKTPEVEVDPRNVIYGDYIPSFRVDDERKAAFEEAQKDPTVHYDADKDLRNRGTGYYKFSTDEEERKQQMEALRIARKETEEKQASKSSLVEKRRLLLEARREKLGKRRRSPSSHDQNDESSRKDRNEAEKAELKSSADDFLSGLYKEFKSKRTQ